MRAWISRGLSRLSNSIWVWVGPADWRRSRERSRSSTTRCSSPTSRRPSVDISAIPTVACSKVARFTSSLSRSCWSASFRAKAFAVFGALSFVYAGWLATLRFPPPPPAPDGHRVRDGVKAVAGVAIILEADFDPVGHARAERHRARFETAGRGGDKHMLALAGVDDRIARQIAEKREARERNAALAKRSSRRTLEEFMAQREGRTLVLVGFGMGVWIGGIIVLRSLEIAADRMDAPVSILPTGYNKKEVFKALRRLSPDFDQTIIIGYPPFVKELVDEAEGEDIDLTKLNIRFVFAAEAFTERFREYLCAKAGVDNLLKDTLNIYGTADLGGMAYETPLSILVRRLAQEDPSFRVKTDEESGQTIIAGMGELHLEIIVDRMKREFGVEANVGKPQVAYRETIRRKVTDQEGKFVRQSGGKGQYGHVVFTVEPNETGKGFEFVDAIKGGVVPREYIPAVQKGVEEALNSGVLAGYPVVDVKVTLTFGSYHEVDSSEQAFKMAAIFGFKEGAKKAQPVILEPMMAVEVETPEDYAGNVMGDLSSRRGMVQGMDDMPGGGKVIKAEVPLSEMFGYSTTLRSMSQGRATYTMEFKHYAEAPRNVAEAIVAARQK